MAGTCQNVSNASAHSAVLLLENSSQVPEPLILSPVPGSASPATVDVIDLIVLVECHSLHAVCEGSI